MIIYFIIAFCATFVGSLIGLGGGIIIKPILDFMGQYPLEVITFMSTATVFAMSSVSLIKHQRNKKKPFTIEALYIIVGSVIGSSIGSFLLVHLTESLKNTDNISKVQASLLIIVLVSIIIINLFNMCFNISRKWFYMIISGIIMGTFSTFLGIGGGPVNIVILMVGFGYSIKRAAILSTVSVLFSQITSLAHISVGFDYSTLDFNILFVMILGGILGGFLGPVYLEKLENKQVNNIYKFTMIFLILINIGIILK